MIVNHSMKSIQINIYYDNIADRSLNQEFVLLIDSQSFDEIFSNRRLLW